ncbi:post-transcriptional regulator [Kyrpidia sp.]|uniref:post-transcriptional regulator n=1 Tax=Kyrpidia sp. TaxID=2073077 RepID=UPI0025844F09|nr:post-transcriptional regulator [Kyrpidia sp.]MCL6575406.1 post-transcriptional regulator [Kyrpidia sp.]
MFAPEEWPMMSPEELTRSIEELCHSKAREFAVLGYDNVTGQEIWQCVSSRYKNGFPALHRIVNDILSLKPTQYMDWAMVKAMKGE